MKNMFKTLAAVAMIALAASCSKDAAEAPAVVDETAKVSFTVELPGIVSRATNDGTTATELHYAVYQDNGDNTNTLLFSTDVEDQVKTMSGLSTTVELNLVSQQTYDIVFWAQARGAYDPDFAAKSVAMNYDSNKVGSNEARDAFVYVWNNLTVNGSINEKVELRRPFAQLNVALTDGQIKAAHKAGFTLDQVKVSAKTHNAFGFFAAEQGAPVGEMIDIEFAAADYELTPNTIEVNNVDYDWVSFNYLLACTPSELVDVNITFLGEQNKSIEVPAFTNVPVERNHRTNIVGDLLTDPAKFEVVILPGFENDEHVVEAWDGKTISKPAYDAATETFTIQNGAELAWIAALVNGTLPAESRAGELAPAENLAGQIVKLAKDIYLGGHEWTPIGIGTKRFHGTLEGNNHAIYDLKVSQRAGGYAQAALVANVAGTVAFRNVTISGAKIVCPDYTGDYYGAAMVGTMYGNVTFDNVKVVNSYISGNNKVGALVAHDGVCSSLNIQNCHVSGTTFEALNAEDGGSVGGLVGFFQGVAKGTNAAPYGDHHVANSSVKKCVFNVINSTNSGKRANAQLIGGISSKEGQELYIDQCVVENNTWNERFYADGVEVTTGMFVSPYGILIGGDRNDAPKGEVYIDGQKVVILTPIAEGVGMDSNGNYVVTANEGLAWVASNVAANNGFEGKTIMLETDVDLAEVKTMGDSFAPIGSTGERDDRNRLICEPFKGTFDGNGKTISNLYQSGWDMGYEWGQYGSIGLFSELEGATVKNVVIEGLEAQIEGGDISFIAGSATGDCVFENIEIKSGGIGTYNNGIGSIIGWSGAGNYTFKNIKIGKDVVLGGLWGSFDSSVGGMVGQAEPGASYHFEDVEINCRLDVYNDVTAAYKYYIYRMSGMIIGRCEATTTIDGRNYPDLSKYNITCKNVTVNYGDWMNYHYCVVEGKTAWRHEPGYAYGGIPADHDHSTCAMHHNLCLPFDGLFGGDQYGVNPIKEYPGVTVNYPASYNPEN